MLPVYIHILMGKGTFSIYTHSSILKKDGGSR